MRTHEGFTTPVGFNAPPGFNAPGFTAPPGVGALGPKAPKLVTPRERSDLLRRARERQRPVKGFERVLFGFLLLVWAFAGVFEGFCLGGFGGLG